MRSGSIRGCLVLVLTSALAHDAWAQKSKTSEPESARRFVQAFYAWYVPLAKKDPSVTRALRERRSQFRPELARALRADLAASAANGNEVVGLDGDPFLNAQDPCDKYDAVSSTRVGATYHVGVVGKGWCKDHTTPDIVAEVTRRDGRWVFLNFIYSTKPKDNLMDLLTQLQSDRGRKR